MTTEPTEAFFGGPCAFGWCGQTAAHVHGICPTCITIAFGNPECPTCRAEPGYPWPWKKAA